MYDIFESPQPCSTLVHYQFLCVCGWVGREGGGDEGWQEEQLKKLSLNNQHMTIIIILLPLEVVTSFNNSVNKD